MPSDGAVDRCADLGCLLAFLAPYLDLYLELRRRGRQPFEEELHGGSIARLTSPSPPAAGVEAAYRFGDRSDVGGGAEGEAMASSSCPSSAAGLVLAQG